MRGSTAGLADPLEGESAAHRALLALLDMGFSCTVIAPAIVGYWRGTWNLSHIYIYPTNVIYSALVSVAIGFLGNMPMVFLQKAFKKYLHPDRSRLVYYITSRIYTYICAAVGVNSWRGAWLLLEYLMKQRGGGAAAMAVSLVALAALRCLRNITSAPFTITADNVDGYFEVPTMFRISVSREPLLYFLDCLFSVVVVGSLVVFVWRGAWDLLDVYMFPLDKSLSAWTSFVLGYGIAIVAFLLQSAARRACAKLKGAKRLVVADLFLLMSFMATINVWRSIWMLLDIYFLPENPELSNWITHCGCFLLLMLLNCGNSVLVRGVYIDAEEEGGQCVVFPCYYLRLFFQKERIKKRQKRLEGIASQKGDLEAFGGEPLLSKSGPHPVIVKSATSQNHITMHETNNETAKETNGENNNENA